MTDASAHFMVSESYGLHERLAAFLRPRGSAKELARAIGCDPRTIENTMAGHWPNARTWTGIVRAFGRDVLEAVFSPEIDAVEARLDREERDAHQTWLAARARREAARRGVVGAQSARLEAGDR